MQTMRILDWYRDMAETFGASRDYYADLEVSEDCLYLNVWAPTRAGGEPLPVMVWIHGGGMTIGSGSQRSYDGEHLAEKGVVVVTINYRLNIFGFFAHPDLSAESEHGVSGNARNKRGDPCPKKMHQ